MLILCHTNELLLRTIFINSDLFPQSWEPHQTGTNWYIYLNVNKLRETVHVRSVSDILFPFWLYCLQKRAFLNIFWKVSLQTLFNLVQFQLDVQYSCHFFVAFLLLHSLHTIAYTVIDQALVGLYFLQHLCSLSNVSRAKY